MNPADVRARLAEIIHETDATEVAAMEQSLMADGMSVNEIRSMCDLHAEVLRDILVEVPRTGRCGGDRGW